MTVLLRDRRTEAGMNQTDLAARLGITASAISMWETGRSLPSLANFVSWADAFGFTVTLKEKA